MARMARDNRTVLTLWPPEKLSKHFLVPADQTEWRGSYLRCPKGGSTPDRNKAPFTIGKSLLPLEPRTTLNERLERETSGLYMLAFDIPFAALYIGISVAASEGILTRIRKHRIKATGSHVGNQDCTSYGGVNHTEGWTCFAPKRHSYFSKRQQFDNCKDARLSFGKLSQSYADNKVHAAYLGYFEHAIKRRVQLLEKVIGLFWPGKKLDDVYMLTCSTHAGQRPPSPALRLWDGTTLRS